MTTSEPEYSWQRMQDVKGQSRSVSQVKSYLPELGGCGYAYFLNRIARAWSKPAAWLPQGLAVHEAAEFWEKSNRTASREEVIAAYQKSYREHTTRLEHDTPNLNFWFPSGPYKGWDDITRRALLGLDMVDRYLKYYQETAPNEVIWITPDGEPAIELRFDMVLDGIKITGFIDQVISMIMDGKLRLRDIKSGNSPGDTFQLKVYDIAVLEEFGIAIGEGDYWMGRKGKPTKPYDLTPMSREQVIDLFGKMDSGVKQESFEPDPSPDKCRFCSVASACQYREG